MKKKSGCNKSLFLYIELTTEQFALLVDDIVSVSPFRLPIKDKILSVYLSALDVVYLSLGIYGVVAFPCLTLEKPCAFQCIEQL